MSKITRVPFVLLLSFVLIVIWWIAYPRPEESEGCTPLPEEFEGSDLIGTWVADSYVYPVTIDTLILRDDHRYVQTVEIEFADEPEYYESEWNEWWFEIAEGGIGYLHLSGYRDCAIDGGECDIAFSRESELDICNEIYIYPEPDEVILIVKGIPDGFALTNYPIILLFPRGPEASPWGYVIPNK